MGTAERFCRLLLPLCVLTSAGLFLLPGVRQAVSEIRQADLMLSYEAEWREVTQAELDSMRTRAEEYNRGIAEKQKYKLFSYQGEEATDEVYEQMLSVVPGGSMGELTIPSIGLALPIAHGTRTDTLDYECGHIYGSSLPNGGVGTHCVLAAHTGLTSAVLFTNLDQVEVGEHFYVKTAEEIHDYAVNRIKVVWPGEEWDDLQVEDGRDLVTLYTCTPCGINDHRLMVTGERVFPDPEVPDLQEERKREAKELRKDAVIRLAAGTAAYAGIVFLVVRNMRREKRRTKRECDIERSDGIEEETKSEDHPDPFGAACGGGGRGMGGGRRGDERQERLDPTQI